MPSYNWNKHNLKNYKTWLKEEVVELPLLYRVLNKLSDGKLKNETVAAINASERAICSLKEKIDGLEKSKADTPVSRCDY